MKAPKVGARVSAPAVTAMGKKLSHQRFGSLASTRLVLGTILSQQGTGRAVKWRIRWDDPSIPVSDHASRQLDAAADPAAVDLGAAAPVAPPAAEPGAAPAEDPPLPEEDAPAPPEDPVHDKLVVHGVHWKIDPCLVDARDKPRMKARLLWPGAAKDLDELSRREIDYFLWSFPSHLVPKIIKWTTESMQRTNPKTAALTRGEFWKLLGFLLATTRTRKKRRDLFSLEDGLFPAAAFGKRFGIGRKRIELVLKHLQLGEHMEGVPESAMCDFIKHINEARAQGYYPSWSIVVDESMSAWRGKDGNFCSDGLPHVTKIDRKPKGVGAELKDAADSATNIIISLEYQLSSEKMAGAEFRDKHNAGTSQLLRLTKSLHGTGRTVNADSAFASVSSAVALADVGLFFKGMVKTATTKFPIKFLREIEYPTRGDWVTLRAEVDGHVVYATGWGDMTRKNLVHTDGVSSEGDPHFKRRWRECEDRDGTELELRPTKRPKVVGEYFEAAKVIDVHNHMRQGGLALEQSWGTQNWEHRLASTLFGMLETDAYCAMKHFHPDSHDIDHADFTEELALQLLTNTIDEDAMATRGTQPEIPNDDDENQMEHEIVQISSNRNYTKGTQTENGKQKKAHLRCVHCHEQASWYCITCTIKRYGHCDGQLVSVCGLSSKRGARCINAHFK